MGDAMRLKLLLAVPLLLLLPALGPAAEKGLTIKGVRYFSYPTFTRVVFEAEAAAPYVLTRAEDGKGLVLGAYDGPLALKAALPAIQDGVVKGMELQGAGERPVIVITLAAAGDVKDFVLRGPDRIVLDITRLQAAAPEPAQPRRKHAVVVIDPGHGGRDPGIIAQQGPEKQRTLELSQAVRKLLKKKDSSLTVLLTREKDQTLTLDERAAAANAAGAAVFLSLHAAAGNGVRAYFLEPDVEQAPASAAGRKDFLGFEAETAQQGMLWGRQQAAHAAESMTLARKLMQALTGREQEAPSPAPLALLKGVDAAAVLVEAGVETDREAVAALIVKGLEQYVREIR